MSQMNILMFHAESWDGRMLGCQGVHPAMQEATPNIDRLAAGGTLFQNAYCTNPICCPSRANMLSGTYTHTCESWNNFKGLETGMWTYHQALAKTHDMLLLGKHMDHLTGTHSVMNRIADFLEPLNTVPRSVMNADPAQDYAIDPGDQRRCHKRDWQTNDRAVEFIKSRANSDKPFFICLNPGLVHASFHTNRYWLDKIPAELVDAPPMGWTTRRSRPSAASTSPCARRPTPWSAN
jgi:arylsulfatase A-like enzyme